MIDVELIAAAVAEAEEKIGRQRAVIALQGLVHEYQPLRVINGEVSEETALAISIVAHKLGADRLVELYQAKLEARFPAEFASVEEPVEEAVAEEAPRKSTRRVR
jgi:hypothetical protein